MEIRIATAADWPHIIDIYNQAVAERFCTADTEPTTVESRQAWLEQHSDERYPILVAEDKGELLGWCSLSPYRPGRKALFGTAEISYYLDRTARGRGIASRLMERAVAEAGTRNVHTLIAILMDVNQPSIRLLEKYQYERWGHLPDIARFENGNCGQFIYGRKI
jgi:phosphinothricin acetyltransferase